MHADLSPGLQQARIYVETDVCNESNDNIVLISYCTKSSFPDGHVVARMTPTGQLLPEVTASATNKQQFPEKILCGVCKDRIYIRFGNKIMVKGTLHRQLRYRTGFRPIRMDKDYGLFQWVQV